MDRIPATLHILTRDSAKLLPKALASAERFDDIVVLDARSEDETQEIARAAGARIIEQDATYLTPDRRITDFSAIRNQALVAARYSWHFFLDSDELLTPALVEEIAHEVATASPGAYWVPRKYQYRGRTIERASTYPIQQMRFFHADVVTRFIKPIHERIELKPDTLPRRLGEAMLVPLPDSARELRMRWKRYLLLEQERIGSIRLARACRLSARELGLAAYYLLRTARVIASMSPSRLPLSFEIARIEYQLGIARVTFMAGLRSCSKKTA